ncbi:hypothetical protein BTA51_05690 [Hahella sp. CCB-MM4]|uniref:DUF4336 domain-containing protein n=1 Tax=Hahella sp. (strain CCB-MM4) TaxID=1926491 RepID=UPI000B9B9BBA|nr:DUF4336 domain-containing protein [Hahella sp. CCB-MM4]OZG74494.1 hypothetical protein BTA51_05690 [Hahella sp. CCB-MM4]
MLTTLEPIADNLWTVSAPQHFLGFHVGTKMTVVRLSNGSLLLHSPVSVSHQVKKALDELGPVSHIVCPNLYHHLYAGEVLKLFPTAKLHGPAKLHKKRKDLPFDYALSDSPHSDWVDDLEVLTIEGSMLHETVFYHKPSATLISCDLVENFRTSGHWPTLLWLKVGGLHGKVGWHHLLKLVYWKRSAARQSILKMLEWPFERAIIAHGRILEEDAHHTMEQAFRWLLK